jgi:hypothetical protein
MVPGDYIPDEESEIDENAFRLLPNTAIEYKYLLNGQDIVYHLELNSVKLDKRKRPVKKIQIRPVNYSKLDPNRRIRPRELSREEYDVVNHESESPEIKEEEQFFEENFGDNCDTYNNLMWQFNLIHQSRIHNRNNPNNS